MAEQKDTSGVGLSKSSPTSPDPKAQYDQKTLQKTDAPAVKPQGAVATSGPIAPPIGMDQGLVDPKTLKKEERAEAFQMGLDTRSYAHLKQTTGLERARKEVSKKPTAEEREKQEEEQVKKAQAAEKGSRERVAKAQEEARHAKAA